MSITKTIYIDMDDVLCHTARGCLTIIEREFGKQIAFEQLTTFDLGQACGLRAEEIAELFRIVHQPDELLRLEPMDGAVAVLNEWMAAGYEIAIVTGRPPSTYSSSSTNTDVSLPTTRLESHWRSWLIIASAGPWKTPSPWPSIWRNK